jgi:hypothetical protein
METDATRPEEMTVAQRQERRFKFLHKLYETTSGNIKALVELKGLAEGLGLTTGEAASIGAYLSQEGLIQGSDWIVMTPAGVLEVEAALAKPNEPTAHFQAHVANILDVGHAAAGAPPPLGAPIATAGGATQAQQAAQASFAAARVLLDNIAGAIDQLVLGTELRREVVADIATARAQLGSPKPKAIIVREVLKSLHDMVEGAIGSGVAPQAAWGPILSQLGQLAEALK